MRATVRWVGPMALVALAAVLSAPPVSATTPGPVITGFAASPTSAPSAGGSVTLSAAVSGAQTCTLSVKPSLKGFPVANTCPSGSFSEQALSLPANTTTKAVDYAFTLSSYRRNWRTCRN
jgi:hypothetical protein